MNVCIIAIAKNENLYINEWIEYHIKIGIDHIYVCDNNDKKGESIKSIIKNKNVTVLNYRGISGIQPKAYTECFFLYRKLYDWAIFIDIDEFIILEDKYKDIKEFLNESIFENVDIIRLHWKLYSGGNELKVINNDYSVMKRFTDSISHPENCFGKSIIKTSIQYIGGKIYGHGYFKNKKIKAVNSIGQTALNDWSTIGYFPIYKNAWINHYPTKTIDEYINQKYFRGGPNNNNDRYSTLDYFFKYNENRSEIRSYGENKIKGMS